MAGGVVGVVGAKQIRTRRAISQIHPAGRRDEIWLAARCARGDVKNHRARIAKKLKCATRAHTGEERDVRISLASVHARTLRRYPCARTGTLSDDRARTVAVTFTNVLTCANGDRRARTVIKRAACACPLVVSLV